MLDSLFHDYDPVQLYGPYCSNGMTNFMENTTNCESDEVV